MINNNKNGTDHLSQRQIKRTGAHYTPFNLSEFVAKKIYKAWNKPPKNSLVKVLDPAVGDGNLLISLVSTLVDNGYISIETTAYDTDEIALKNAKNKFKKHFQKIKSKWLQKDFLEKVTENNIYSDDLLFSSKIKNNYDLIIANPPYVRTQQLGRKKSKELSQYFNLNGRVDIYFAFLISMDKVLNDNGVVGIIVSNRFMTTRSGESVRKRLIEKYQIHNIYDFGDTKIFKAAVLPAVLVYKKRISKIYIKPNFSSIYSINDIVSTDKSFNDPTKAVEHEGLISINGDKSYVVTKGFLDYGNFAGDVWRISSPEIISWLKIVAQHTFCNFKDIGKIRVGVKTTADKVFIKNNWEDFNENEIPELLFPLTTHHIADRFRPLEVIPKTRILYTHEVINGKRVPVNLDNYPKARKYLESKKEILEKRDYVLKSGRNWYEIWVPQNPNSWSSPKLVFRDISEKPIFWMDFHKTIVNGDCYWMLADKNEEELLWLALAIGNSSFIIKFYDYKYQNKLYASRRRFITQYVENFPIPNPKSEISQKIIKLSKEIYKKKVDSETTDIELIVDKLIWRSFGLS